MESNLTEKQIEFCEHWYTPVSMIECLVQENEHAPQTWNENCRTITLRDYQHAMLNYSACYADDNKLTRQQNLKIKKGAGDLNSIGSRNTGKSFLLKIDLLLSIVYNWIEICIASFDDYHLKKVALPIADYLEQHKFWKIYHLRDSRKESVQRNPLNAKFEHGVIVESACEHTKGDNPGEQFHAKHFNVFYYEECCVDRNTQIRWVDSSGQIYSGSISKFIHKGLWKNNLVYSYNFDKNKIELKKVVNIFKHIAPRYNLWNLEIESYGNVPFRRLLVSQHQKFWTDKGYKEIENINPTDTLYTYDYFRLSDLQKQILIGTLLGDSCVNKKANGKCHPSLNFVHGTNQQEYFFYKKQCFNNLFRSFHRYKIKKDWHEQFTSYGGKVYCTTTDTCLDFYEFLNFKKDSSSIELLKKYLTPISLAFWIMDDAQLIGNKGKTEKAKYLQINSQGFSEEFNIQLQQTLKNKFNLDCEVKKEERFNKVYFKLVFDNKNTLNLIDLIKDYIHPTLYYKIYTKCELCKIIFDNQKPKFIDLSTKIQEILQPVKLLSKTLEYRKSWTMFDIEVEDNHNFFASGILISNSYQTNEGTQKRVDSGDSLGYIYRPSGIPDLDVGSPLGKILQDPNKKNWLWQLPQFVREDYTAETHQKMIDEYGGENTAAMKLNVLAETIEGAFGFFDMDRIRESINNSRRVKFFEIGKETFHKFDELLVIERLPGAEQVYVAMDVGYGAAPTEIIIIFKANKKYKYIYNISLFRLTQLEQAQIVKWIYDKLGSAFVSIDATGEGGTIIDELFRLGVPQENLLKVKFNENIEVDFEKDKDGNILIDDNGNPVMKLANTEQFSFEELERLLYSGECDIAWDDKFITQFTNILCKQIGLKKRFDSKGANHLVQGWQVWCISRFFNEFNILKNQNTNQTRCFGVVNTGDF